MVLRGGEPGGCLTGFWMHFPETRHFGDECVRAHVEYYNATDVDILKVMNEHPYKIGCAIEKPEDWRYLRPHRAKEYYAGYLEELRKTRRTVGPDVPLLATIHGVLVSACHATDGMGKFTDPDNTVTRHLKEDPAPVAAGLEAVAQTLDDLCAECVAAGADGIYYAALGGEEYRFDEALFVRYVKPLERIILENAHRRGLVFLHICKDRVRLPMYQGCTADVVNWATNECRYTLADGARLFPESVILGGFDNRGGALLSASPEELERQMRQMRESVGNGRFIVGADCTLPAEMDYGRIRTIVDIAHAMC